MANVPMEITLPDGSIIRGILDQFVRDAALRLTWQVSPQNKFAGMYCSGSGSGRGKDFTYGADPRASQQRDTEDGMLRSRAGAVDDDAEQQVCCSRAATPPTWSSHTAYGSAPGRLQDAAFSPEWYAHAQKTDTALNKNFYPQCAYTTGCTSWDGGQPPAAT